MTIPGERELKCNIGLVMILFSSPSLVLAFFLGFLDVDTSAVVHIA